MSIYVHNLEHSRSRLAYLNTIIQFCVTKSLFSGIETFTSAHFSDSFSFWYILLMAKFVTNTIWKKKKISSYVWKSAILQIFMHILNRWDCSEKESPREYDSLSLDSASCFRCKNKQIKIYLPSSWNFHNAKCLFTHPSIEIYIFQVYKKCETSRFLYLYLKYKITGPYDQNETILQINFMTCILYWI